MLSHFLNQLLQGVKTRIRPIIPNKIYKFSRKKADSNKIQHSLMFWNGLGLLLMSLLIIYAKFFEPSISGLFMPPSTPPYPTAGILTHTFQLLCCIPPVICGFSFGLLNSINSQNQKNKFILGSAIVTGGLALNEIYRIHIISQYFNLPKPLSIKVYAVILVIYLVIFFKNFKSTPYGIILLSIALLLMAIAVDSLNLNLIPYRDFLEGIPKLFSGLNLALYFWLVCYQELLIAFKLK